MHQSERALDPVVLQVDVEATQLRGGEHALVDEGAAGKAGEVHGFASRTILAGALVAQLGLDPFAHHVGTPFEVFTAAVTGDEDLPERRHRVTGQGTERALVGGHVTPAENRETFGLHDLLDTVDRGLGVAGTLREKRDTGGVGAFRWQLEIDHGTEELVRYLDHDSGTVAGVRLGSCRTSVFEVHQGRDGLVDDVATASSMHVDNKGNAAGVVLVLRVIEPYRAGSVLHTFRP